MHQTIANNWCVIQKYLFLNKMLLLNPVAEPGAYWTSGIGVEGEFAWCPSGKDIDGELWIPSSKPKTKKCVSLVVGEAIGLENTSCDMALHVLCESNEY